MSSVNLSVLTFMRRFIRLSKKLECLAAACAMYVAYYDFVWRTRYLDRAAVLAGYARQRL